MSHPPPDEPLTLLRQLPPSVSLDTVCGWVQAGRLRPRLHTLAWLSRVGWRKPN